MLRASEALSTVASNVLKNVAFLDGFGDFGAGGAVELLLELELSTAVSVLLFFDPFGRPGGMTWRGTYFFAVL